MKKTVIRMMSVLCILAVLTTMLVLPAAAASGKYFPRYTGTSGSIVTGLNAVGVNSSYAYRCRIAAANGISGYRGTASQNITMLNLLKQGRLINPDAPAQTAAPVPAPANNNYFSRYTGTSGSIVTGLNAVGANSSYAYRSQIAAANGITGYRGTASQNVAMLNLLKQGKLIRPGTQTPTTATPTTTTQTVQMNAGASSWYDAAGSASIRSKPYSTGSVLYKVSSGTSIPVTSATVNKYGNTWYITNYGGTVGYIYAGNVKAHSHSYETVSYDGVTYHICDCGNVKVTVKTTETVKLKRSETMAMYLSMAGMSAVADGPVPLGDVIAAGLLVLGAYECMTMTSLTSTQAINMLREVNFDEYLKQRENQCSNTSFRRVIRVDGTLKYMDDRCLTLPEAYVYVRYMHGDVHTKYYGTATALGALHGAYYTERDSNQLNCYYHVHLGSSAANKVGGHVFYGCNGYGKWPS